VTLSPLAGEWKGPGKNHGCSDAEERFVRIHASLVLSVGSPVFPRGNVKSYRAIDVETKSLDPPQVY